MDIYEPAEDSYLLQKVVEKYAHGNVLDMGTGSGIQALTAVKSPHVKKVMAVDVNPEAIKELQNIKKEQKLSKLKVIHSDLFENVPPSKFDVIIFNAPYLPQGKEDVGDIALYGGKKGWEISARFFEQAVAYLKPVGIILFLFSTLTNKTKIEEILHRRFLEFEVVSKQKISFEELYVYKIGRSPVLQELEKKKITNVSYYAKGKRGEVYTGRMGKRKVAIKIERSLSHSLAALEREAQILAKVNAKKIGAQLLFAQSHYLVLDYIEGTLFEEWLLTHSKMEILKVIKSLLNQCFMLDTMGITKEEMHHPFKHIIITLKNKPVLIDFERAHMDLHPQNVTQFVDYLCRLQDCLTKSGINIDKNQLRSLSAQYKKDYSLSLLKQIYHNLV